MTDKLTGDAWASFEPYSAPFYGSQWSYVSHKAFPFELVTLDSHFAIFAGRSRALL